MGILCLSHAVSSAQQISFGEDNEKEDEGFWHLPSTPLCSFGWGGDGQHNLPTGSVGREPPRPRRLASRSWESCDPQQAKGEPKAGRPAGCRVPQPGVPKGK